MASIRLPAELEHKLSKVAEAEKTTKSEIVKQALTDYLDRYDESISPFELGKDLFGKQDSGRGNLSRDYKTLLKQKLHGKHSH